MYIYIYIYPVSIYLTYDITYIFYLFPSGNLRQFPPA